MTSKLVYYVTQTTVNYQHGWRTWVEESDRGECVTSLLRHYNVSKLAPPVGGRGVETTLYKAECGVFKSRHRHILYNCFDNHIKHGVDTLHELILNIYI